MTKTPPGARPAARILVIDAGLRVLLLRAVDDGKGNSFWLTPGGGVEQGESFEAAATRELLEETGLTAQLGPCVWTRRAVVKNPYSPMTHDQYELFFVVRVIDCDICPPCQDSYVIEHRWWTLPEIQTSQEHFVPTRLAELLPPIFRGEYPASPFDCGI